MTYILGARCPDGVVIVADKRVTESNGEVRYENKTFCNIEQAVWASAGTREDFGWFSHRINEKAAESIPQHKLLPIVSDVIQEGRRMGLLQDFELLFGIRFPAKRTSQLFFFNRDGGSREISDYFVIGRGEPVGRLMLKKFYRSDLPTFKVAVLGIFIIRYIESEHLDDSVGIDGEKPTIWWLPDLPEPYMRDSDLPDGVYQAFRVRQEDSEIEPFMEPVDSMVTAWQKHIDSFFPKGL